MCYVINRRLHSKLLYVWHGNLHNSQLIRLPEIWSKKTLEELRTHRSLVLVMVIKLVHRHRGPHKSLIPVSLDLRELKTVKLNRIQSWFSKSLAFSRPTWHHSSTRAASNLRRSPRSKKTPASYNPVEIEISSSLTRQLTRFLLILPPRLIARTKWRG